MIPRIIIAVGAVGLAVGAWVAFQPQPDYVDFEPLPAPESYFPVSPGGETKIWYARANIAPLGTVLQASEEPTIFYRTEGEAEWEIRFTLIPEYGEPLTARVRPTEDGYALIAKRIETYDGVPVETDSSRVRRLSEADVTRLVDGLNAMSFYDIPGPAPELEPIHLGWVSISSAHTEGDLWAIEWRRGHGDDDYHLVIRDSRTDLSGFEELALGLFDRVGFRPYLADHPVTDYDEVKDEAQINGEARPRLLNPDAPERGE